MVGVSFYSVRLARVLAMALFPCAGAAQNHHRLQGAIRQS